MKRWIVFLVIAGTLAWNYWPEPARTYAPGVLVARDPIQTQANQGQKWQKGNYTFTPLAEFDITARILSKERYRFDREAELAPIDFAMGWGPMSDQAVLDKITISQSGRWYHWRVREFPIPQSEIESHSGNMHMIPATDLIRKKLLAVRTGDIVHISGYLVRVDAADGWHWVSSTSRKDTGGGSCEVVWVNEISVE
jgi:hypothetical protein